LATQQRDIAALQTESFIVVFSSSLSLFAGFHSYGHIAPLFNKEISCDCVPQTNELPPSIKETILGMSVKLSEFENPDVISLVQLQALSATI
jgi:hypothetical protein